MDRTECTEALAPLGFTALEAEVYAALVEQSTATAYKLAQEIGKAAANVYKAIEALQRKGAVLVEESETRLCRAVPPKELLQRLDHEFSRARSRAEAALSQLMQAGGDDRVYRLTSVEQVLARARAMLRRTEKMVLCDLFPGAAEAIREDLEAAARRGRRVYIQVYRPITIHPRVKVFVESDAERLLRVWPGPWLNVVSDAREHLLALLHPGLTGVYQAVWSESAYLALTYYSGLSSEMLASALGAVISRPSTPKALRSEYESVRRLLRGNRLPGYLSMLARYGTPSPSRTRERGSSKASPRRRTAAGRVR